jgi:hypothetical protein
MVMKRKNNKQKKGFLFKNIRQLFNHKEVKDALKILVCNVPSEKFITNIKILSELLYNLNYDPVTDDFKNFQRDIFEFIEDISVGIQEPEVIVLQDICDDYLKVEKKKRN